MIDKENRSMMGADLKGKIYEGLLEKNAEDVTTPHAALLCTGHLDDARKI